MCLEAEAAISYERRHEAELPPVKAQVTEHQRQIKRYRHCGAQT